MDKSTVADGGRLSRRQFLRVAGGLGLSISGLALLPGCRSQPAAPSTEEETLETTTIRLYKVPSLCQAPQFLAEDLLKAEGFTEVQYVEITMAAAEKSLAAGDFPIGQIYAPSVITQLDAGVPLVMLAGVHVGCWELFATEQIQAIRDLKGKTTSVSGLGGVQYLFLAILVAWGGLDPNTDINWAVVPIPEQGQFLADGKVDAVLAFPPFAQELRAKKIGHVILNSMMDDPWSQYNCCMVTANREFAQKNPVATKRALRAILKASDICALEPERAAQFVVDEGYTTNYDYALEAIKNIPFNVWREYDPEDTLRFYALRLREAGLIKSTPNEIIARGTDWRFLNEIKAEF